MLSRLVGKLIAILIVVAVGMFLTGCVFERLSGRHRRHHLDKKHATKKHEESDK